MLRLSTFGGLGIEPDDGLAAAQLRPSRLALLAVLAAAERGVSRERLAGLFWPEADEAHASHSLRQVRYALRNDLGREVIRSAGSVLILDETAITADVCEFRAALATGDRARAVSLARGPYLDGFYLPGVPAFERWVEEERARIMAATTSALVSLAIEATRAGERDAAVEWWRQLTTREPLSGRFALGYLKALAARGDRAEALAFARWHQALVRRELEADPDPEIRRLEAELRAIPSPSFASVPSHAGPQLDAVVRNTRTEPTSRRARTRRVLDISQGRPRRRAVVVAAVGLLVLILAAAVTLRRWPAGRADSRPVIAVGLIRDDGVPESQRVGRVLTDMLATNLARVEGLAVVSNSRLLELMRPERDSSAAAYADAARRAGASELIEGRLIVAPNAAFVLDVRRVDLATGLVKSVHRVSAADQYALVDSLTQSVGRHFRLLSPATSVAQATTMSPAAYRLYEEGLRAYAQSDVNAAQRLMHAALEEDSAFAMAAYYEAVAGAELGEVLPDGRHVTEARRNALRLALRAPERERLTITANLLAEEWEPGALAVAESLTTRYPDDPRALMTLSKVRWATGDWPGAAAVIERAIALDSIAPRRGNCSICEDYGRLSEVYLWWDSLPAAERTARRYLAAKPDAWQPVYLSCLVRARLGDSASTYAAFHRLSAMGGDNRHLKLRLDLTLESYENVERDARALLSSASAHDWGTGAWAFLIALRNQGRVREATQLHHTGRLPGVAPPLIQRTPDDFNEAILAIERGEPGVAAAVFARRVRGDASQWSPGYQARLLTWNATLQGMALAAAGDTLAVRSLADSVERWGRASAYGRDRRAHHYLRGLVFAAAAHDDDAVREFRAAMHSANLGFTRVNYELARSLLRLKRPREAADVLQSALRGEVDASNLYVTRTDLHELLGQAFDAAGLSDSAAVHYRAVVRAWQRADPAFYARRARAAEWLARSAAARTSADADR